MGWGDGLDLQNFAGLVFFFEVSSFSPSSPLPHPISFSSFDRTIVSSNSRCTVFIPSLPSNVIYLEISPEKRKRKKNFWGIYGVFHSISPLLPPPLPPLNPLSLVLFEIGERVRKRGREGLVMVFFFFNFFQFFTSYSILHMVYCT